MKEFGVGSFCRNCLGAGVAFVDGSAGPRIAGRATPAGPFSDIEKSTCGAIGNGLAFKFGRGKQIAGGLQFPVNHAAAFWVPLLCDCCMGT